MQWNLLSNLVHYFDEYSGYSFIEAYIRHQNTLPPKTRYRYASVKNLSTSLLTNIQLVFEKNRDFLFLSPFCPSTALPATTQCTLSIGSLLALRKHHLFDNELLYRSVQMIFLPSSVVSTRWIMDQLDSDEIFVKLVLAIIAFSTNNSIVHTQSVSIDLVDMKTMSSVQNMYVELTWQYLLHRYNHHEAVSRFSNIIRCVILMNDIVIEANEFQRFMKLTDTIIKQTEQKLHISERDTF